MTEDLVYTGDSSPDKQEPQPKAEYLCPGNKIDPQSHTIVVILGKNGAPRETTYCAYHEVEAPRQLEDLGAFDGSNFT